MLFASLFITLILICSIFDVIESRYGCRTFLRMSRPVTYVPVPVMDKSLKREITILVKSNDPKTITEVNNWKSKGKIPDEKASQFEQEGIIIRLDDSGKQLGNIVMKSTAAKSATASSSSSSSSGSSSTGVANRRNNLSRSNFASYMNIGTEKDPLYLRMAKQSIIDEYTTGRISADTLIEKGYAFRNVDDLFQFERKFHHREDIAVRVRDEFAMTSDVWQRWTNKTTITNTTSLTQVFAEYFKSHSIGDIGGKNVDYIPRRGFPGTLAPGELFKDNSPPENLPKHIAHPWPAMQEIRFHGRMPVTHPMIPPPVLWFGLNNMYTNNFTRWQLNTVKEGDRILGGQHMTPKDAMLIARNATFGSSYELSHQLPHGGSIHATGHIIPFYHPDHGPTIPEEDAQPPIPPHLREITERWYNPYEDNKMIDTYLNNEQLIELENSEKEEKERQLKYQTIITKIEEKSEWYKNEVLNEIQKKIEIKNRFDQIYESEISRIKELELIGPEDPDVLSFTSNVSPAGATTTSAASRRKMKNKITNIDLNEDDDILDDNIMNKYTSQSSIYNDDNSDDDNDILNSMTSSSSSSSSSDIVEPTSTSTTTINILDDDDDDIDNIIKSPFTTATTTSSSSNSNNNLLSSLDDNSRFEEQIDPATELAWLYRAEREIALEREISQAAMGTVRSQKRLNQYVINFMREQLREMGEVEIKSQINSSGKKRGGRRKKGSRSKLGDNDDIAVDDPMSATLDLSDNDGDSDGDSETDSDSDNSEILAVESDGDSDPFIDM